MPNSLFVQENVEFQDLKLEYLEILIIAYGHMNTFRELISYIYFFVPLMKQEKKPAYFVRIHMINTYFPKFSICPKHVEKQ